MRELRHDFRRIYHVAYDEVPTDEATDLVCTLPDGSLYVSAVDPSRRWGEARTLAADVLDAIAHLTWAMAYDHEKVPHPPTLTRPADVQARERAKESQARARRVLETSDWVEV